MNDKDYIVSDDTYCDVCRKLGRRRVMKHCPDGWFYGESPNDDDENPLNNTHIVVICSEQCKNRFFLPGPGDLNTRPEYIEKAKNGNIE